MQDLGHVVHGPATEKARYSICGITRGRGSAINVFLTYVDYFFIRRGSIQTWDLRGTGGGGVKPITPDKSSPEESSSVDYCGGSPSGNNYGLCVGHNYAYLINITLDD